MGDDKANGEDGRNHGTAALREYHPDDLAIRRLRRGRGFIYVDPQDRRITAPETLARIRSLAIPPNYRDVRIADAADAHLQATGYDSAGRMQYRYHPGWEEIREWAKVDRLDAISRTIGRIRRRIARDIRQPPGSKEKALAAVVMLIDRSHIRIGCENYVHSGRSRGAATLLKRHVAVEGEQVRLSFRGKGGKNFSCAIRAPALARAIGELMGLKGARLFQYTDASGRRHPVTAADVNAFLQEIAGAPVSAKDFRTLAASAEAADRLARMDPAATPTARRRQVAGVMREVSELLGNTPAVVRKSYVHRTLVSAFENGSLSAIVAEVSGNGERRRAESLVAAVIGTARNEGRGASRGTGQRAAR